MTTGELIALLKDRDPSDVICVRLMYGHGDNTTHFAQDDVAFGLVAVPGDPEYPAHAVFLMVSGEGEDETQLEDLDA